jgi:hypothetical protein
LSDSEADGRVFETVPDCFIGFLIIVEGRQRVSGRLNIEESGSAEQRGLTFYDAFVCRRLGNGCEFGAL